MAQNSLGFRLEQYTLRRPNEVLMVTAEIDGESDQITIYKGYSSSLMRPTAFDPDVPVLPDHAQVLTVDRLQGPYDLQNPRYIEPDLGPEAVQSLLEAAGV